MALLRYNGGKSKLVKKIIDHISLPDVDHPVYLEPFVGGGSIALAVAARYPKVRIVLNDKESEIANFWTQVAISPKEQFNQLYNRVLTCKPTIMQFRELKATKAEDDLDLAFRTLFFNRTGFSASNGKRPNGGWNQDENGTIGERYNSKRLAQELLDARLLLEGRTTIFNEDFERIIKMADGDWVMYLDPPYYRAGNQMYNHPWEDSDHVRLNELLKTTPANWALSYDFHPRIVELYSGMARSYPVPASYSISKRKEVEALFVPIREENIITSRQGYVAPANFGEFFQRYPKFVRNFVEKKMHWNTKLKGNYTVFTTQVEDYTQDLLMFLSSLPKDSKYRAMGFTDPIQLFNPSLWGGVTQGKFLAYIRMLLANRFQTLRTKQYRDALPYADACLGSVPDATFMNDTAMDFQTYRRFVEQTRPSLLPTFDSFFDRDTRHEIEGYDSSRARLVGLLQQYFVYGLPPQRKEYKKRSKSKRSEV